MSTGREHPWWVGLAAPVCAAFVRVLGATWRIEESNAPGYDRAHAAGERVIYCLWHARLLPLTYHHRDERVAVLVSRSRDGELIARTIAGLGYELARGSSTRGGEAGMRELIACAERGRDIAVTPDGPRGPAERVKEGVVYLASKVGLRIVPVAAAVSRAWVARSWDRFRVPLPFSRIAVAHGEPIAVPAALDDAASERERSRIEAALLDVDAQVRARIAERA